MTWTQLGSIAQNCVGWRHVFTTLCSTRMSTGMMCRTCAHGCYRVHFLVIKISLASSLVVWNVELRLQASGSLAHWCDWPRDLSSILRHLILAVISLIISCTLMHIWKGFLTNCMAFTRDMLFVAANCSNKSKHFYI